MIKNKTDDMLKVELGPGSGWTAIFQVSSYGVSVKLFNRKDEMKTFIQFKPNDVAAIQEFLAEKTSVWDNDEI